MLTRKDEMTLDEVKALINKDNPVVLEIGSNDGYHTRLFLRTFSGVQIYCFEPEPRAIEKWHKLIQDRRASLFEYALDDTEGTKLFYRSSGNLRDGDPTPWDQSGSLCKPTGHLVVDPRVKFEETIMVTTRRLDNWINDNPQPLIDFIWMDVQGSERRVLLGGMETLRHTRYLKLECHQRMLYEGQATESDLRALLGGWTCLARYGEDLIFRNDNTK